MNSICVGSYSIIQKSRIKIVLRAKQNLAYSITMTFEKELNNKFSCLEYYPLKNIAVTIEHRPTLFPIFQVHKVAILYIQYPMNLVLRNVLGVAVKGKHKKLTLKKNSTASTILRSKRTPSLSTYSSVHFIFYR